MIYITRTLMKPRACRAPAAHPALPPSLPPSLPAYLPSPSLPPACVLRARAAGRGRDGERQSMAARLRTAGRGGLEEGNRGGGGEGTRIQEGMLGRQFLGSRRRYISSPRVRLSFSSINWRACRPMPTATVRRFSFLLLLIHRNVVVNAPRWRGGSQSPLDSI